MMKRVTLIGDSIRAGYQKFVAENLAREAEIWGPEDNGRHSVHVLTNIHAWLVRQPADIVHINCGLHDIKTIAYGGRENVVPLDHYRRNVEMILRHLREKTTARVIWATTTPVNEARAHAAHAKAADFDRYEADVVAYNEAAVGICRKLDVPVNDLFGVITRAGADRLLGADGVHFTPEGCALLGNAVAEAIRSRLAQA
jgi:lysophospholipase L1-like esterase